MFISREKIPFKILKQIHDPAYDIFRNAYVQQMGDAEADRLMESFVGSNQALCDREMGWGVPNLDTVLRKVRKMDLDNPLDKDALPEFVVSGRAVDMPVKEESGFFWS